MTGGHMMDNINNYTSDTCNLLQLGEPGVVYVIGFERLDRICITIRSDDMGNLQDCVIDNVKYYGYVDNWIQLITVERKSKIRNKKLYEIVKEYDLDKIIFRWYEINAVDALDCNKVYVPSRDLTRWAGYDR